MRRHDDIAPGVLMRSGHGCVGCDASPVASDADVAEWMITNEDAEGGILMCPHCWADPIGGRGHSWRPRFRFLLLGSATGMCQALGGP
jgi:hypothetical protein